MKTDTQIDFDATTFWQLDAPSRFPASLHEWHEGIEVISCSPHPVRGDLVDRMQGFLQRWDCGLKVAPKLTPSEWRLLYYLSALRFDSASCSGYDPREQIAHACAPGGWLTEVPEEWTAAASTGDLCRTLRQKVMRLTQAEAQMAAVIVAFFRAIPLEKNEVLSTAWYDPSWIRKFLQHVMIVR